MSLAGYRVLSLESRRAKEMETLIRRYGGDPFVAPSVREVILDDVAPVHAWAERLISGEFDLAIFMTGTGLTFLRDMVVRKFPEEAFAESLRKVTAVSRGPKPLSVLHGMGIRPQISIPEPNTWREMIPILKLRPERSITLQEYGRTNLELIAALEELGAKVTPVCVYRWDLPEDQTALREAVRRIALRQCEVVIFTTSVQLHHLIRIAREMEMENKVRKALSEDIVIASVGPIMNDALAEEGLAPDIVPQYPKMGNLLRSVSDLTSEALTQKQLRHRFS